LPELTQEDGRLKELRQRWEREKSPRLFLQLAEEYRRLGHLQDAVAVLAIGLEAHPTHLAARVALGRCQLELNQPHEAEKILEAVVASDPTQLVANKLLIETYLRIRQPEKARDRLDLYNLLNPADGEIEAFERRLNELEVPLPAPGKEVATPSPAASDLAPEVSTGRDAAREPAATVAPSPPAEPAAPRSPGSVFSLPTTKAPPLRLDVPTLAGPRKPRLVAVPRAEPFPSLATARGRRQRYLEGLGAGGIFRLRMVPPASAIAAPQALEAPQTIAAPPPPAPPAAAVAPTIEEVAEASVATVSMSLPELLSAPAAISAPGATATVTLGSLYLRQGHLAEAEAAFREVLAREPGHEQALAGLAEIDTQRQQPASARSLLGPEDGGERAAGGLTARKILLLRRYLERIRGVERRHVS